MKPSPLKILAVLSILLAGLLLLTGCKPQSTTPPAAGENSPSLPTIVPAQEKTQDSPLSTSDGSGPGSQADPAQFESEWQTSPHADTFVVDEQNQNNTCARCHAPNNWAPSMQELPESCFACKFELEDPAPLIEKSAWTNVSCNVCHSVDKKGRVSPEYAWLEIAPLGEYSEVGSPDELCLKCHAPVDIPNHRSIVVAGVHAGTQCTGCHSAHSTAATCGAAGCHDGPIASHDDLHPNVSCIACHDAGGMDVDRVEASGLWTTFISGTTGNGAAKIAFASHDIAREVKCSRCHFAGNAWGLTVLPEKP